VTRRAVRLAAGLGVAVGVVALPHSVEGGTGTPGAGSGYESIHSRCQAVHGGRWCRAVELRHAARALRRREQHLAVAAGYHAPVRPRLPWNVGRLYRHVEWLRHAQLPHLRLVVRAATDERLAISIAARRYRLDPAGMTRVAGCESTGDQPYGVTLNRWATNGDYLGLFQEGTTVRSSYLRGPWWNALENALAAARTVVADGCWCQWSCGWAYAA
jgi:hypothetical protein